MSEGKYEIILSDALLLAAVLLPVVIVIAYLYYDGERIKNIVYVCLTSLFLMLGVNSCINDYYVSGYTHRTMPEVSNAEDIKELPSNTLFTSEEIKLDTEKLVWFYYLKRPLLSVTAMYPAKNHDDVWIVYHHETTYGHGPYYDNPEGVLSEFPPIVYSPSCYTIGWKPSLEDALLSGFGKSIEKELVISGPGKHLLKNKSKVYVFYDQKHYYSRSQPSSDNSVKVKGRKRGIISYLILYAFQFFILSAALSVIVFIDYLEEGDDYEINLSWWRDLLSNDEEDDDQES